MRVTIVILCLVGAALANPVMYNSTMDRINPTPGDSSALSSSAQTGLPELKAQSSSKSQSSEQSNTSELKSTSVSSSEQSNSSEESQSASVSDSSSQSNSSDQTSSQENTSENTTSESSESNESDSSDMTSDESQSALLEDTTSEESHSIEEKFNLAEDGVTKDDSRGSKENLRRFFKVYAVKATATKAISDSHQSTAESKEDDSISNEIPESMSTDEPTHPLDSMSSEDSRARVDVGNSTENSVSSESTEDSGEDSEPAASHESNESKSAECLPGADQDCDSDSDSDSDESDVIDVGDDGNTGPLDGFFMPFDTPGELLLRR